MDIIRVIILGIIEGVTEFLPVSSTGHLILAHEWISLDPQSFQNAFDVCIQLGAILAVVVLYFSKLWPFYKSDENKIKIDEKTMTLWLKVIVGVLPSAVLGFCSTTLSTPISLSLSSWRRPLYFTGDSFSGSRAATKEKTNG